MGSPGTAARREYIETKEGGGERQGVGMVELTHKSLQQESSLDREYSVNLH